MTAESFEGYIEGRFISDLSGLRSASLSALKRLKIHGPEKCEHHQVPDTRGLPLDPRLSISEMEPRFWAAFYLTTVLHQAVHCYAPDQEKVWLDRFGAHPLPMVAKGLGCWNVAKPTFFLGRLQEDMRVTMAACDYIRDRAPAILEDSQITPGELSVQLLADRDFDLSHPIERLVGYSIRQWQNPSV